ncbi:MAG: hypothetical protein ACRDJU_13690 [Actinomycetota bacterium]
MAAAGQALVSLLGVAEVPLLALSELQTAILRVPWMGRLRSPDSPVFSVGLDGIEEEAAEIFLVEGRDQLPGEPGSFRVLHLDEGGYRPGLHAVLRSAGSAVGHAVAAAVAVALARETDGAIADPCGSWIEVPESDDGEPVSFAPDDFIAALRPARRFATVKDGASALSARRPVRRSVPAT